MSTLGDCEKGMQKAIDHLRTELKGIRTGRANPGMVEHVQVEVYGAQMRLQDVASVSTPEPRQLLINPFDVGNVHAIAKSLEAANLNLQPFVDGNVVRINVPEMDASLRQEMTKQARKKCEEAKITIRNARRDSNEQVKKEKSAGDIAEDEMKRLEKKIQDLTDKFCKLADAITTEKEKDIATI